LGGKFIADQKAHSSFYDIQRGEGQPCELVAMLILRKAGSRFQPSLYDL